MRPAYRDGYRVAVARSRILHTKRGGAGRSLISYRDNAGRSYRFGSQLDMVVVAIAIKDRGAVLKSRSGDCHGNRAYRERTGGDRCNRRSLAEYVCVCDGVSGRFSIDRGGSSDLHRILARKRCRRGIEPGGRDVAGYFAATDHSSRGPREHTVCEAAHAGRELDRASCHHRGSVRRNGHCRGAQRVHHAEEESEKEESRAKEFAHSG